MEQVLNHAFYDQLPLSLRKVMLILEEAGYEAYVVGGACRDFLLGRAPHDFDLCTSATPDEVTALFDGRDGTYKVEPTGREYGTVTIITDCDKPHEEVGVYEITTFRGDSYKGLDHTDCEVAFTKSLEEDLARRDFTINAIVYSVKEKSFFDYFGGISDMAVNLLRCVTSPKMSFRQDPLRMLRGVRFMAVLADKNNNAFRLAEDAEAFISKNAALIRYMSAERIQQELNKLLAGQFVADALRMMLKVGLMDIILPEVAIQSRLQHNNPYHKDYWDESRTVFDHVIDVVKDVEPLYPLRLAALLHDIGKIDSIHVKDAGYWAFYGHPEQSARMAKDILARLKYSIADTDFITKLVLWHDDPITVDLKISRKLVKKMMNRFDGNLEVIRQYLNLKHADAVHHHPYKGKNACYLAAIEQCFPMVKEIIEAKEAFSIKDLVINGEDVKEALQIKPGPVVGASLRMVLEKVIEETLPNEKTALIQCIKEAYGRG